MHCILCNVFYALHSMHCIPCIAFYALYSMNCILCIGFSILCMILTMHSDSYLFKAFELTLKLVADRPTIRPTDIVMYRAAIAAKSRNWSLNNLEIQIDQRPIKIFSF